ncbi:MAG TPA: SlyX family protein [Polyangiaceae bacterium]|nr:SlyX family protein [Polyangiaceae bacterium]
MSREPDDRATETRLLNLEEKVAYQDKIIAELNDVVVSLNRVTSAFETRLRGLENALRNDLGARDMPNEKPPHY